MNGFETCYNSKQKHIPIFDTKKSHVDSGMRMRLVTHPDSDECYCSVCIKCDGDSVRL